MFIGYKWKIGSPESYNSGTGLSFIAVNIEIDTGGQPVEITGDSTSSVKRLAVSSGSACWLNWYCFHFSTFFFKKRPSLTDQKFIKFMPE
jgi:hypothetical protein